MFLLVVTEPGVYLSIRAQAVQMQCRSGHLVAFWDQITKLGFCHSV